jgi:hypothetical protein
MFNIVKLVKRIIIILPLEITYIGNEYVYGYDTYPYLTLSIPLPTSYLGCSP